MIMKVFPYKIKLLLLTMSIFAVSCNPAGWLDEKRVLSDVKPETLKDFQAILDNATQMNGRFMCSALAGTDNIVVADKDIQSISEKERQIYLWKGDPWATDVQVTSEWTYPFISIEYANIVLDGIAEQKLTGKEADNIRGQALFFRAYSFLNLMEMFCKQYVPSTANTDKGLPLRTSSDVSKLLQRSSVQETVGQIINDCNQAISLLNESQLFNTRPSAIAAHALLARVYLIMGDYGQALKQTELVLSKKSELLDFNSDKISTGSTYRFPANGVGNEEIIFYAFGAGSISIVRPVTTSRANVDGSLYTSYSGDDLRKQYFYASNSAGTKFRGGYTGGNNNFCGLATNEIYLIKSECEARLGSADLALLTLDKLLLKRYRMGKYIPFTTSDKTVALKRILEERRKELPFTASIRWSDLKRLNLEAEFATAMERTSGGLQYKLSPNDPRYQLPIPKTEILKSGIEQNDY